MFFVVESKPSHYLPGGINEARAVSNLDHPNVVRVDYVCSDDAEECFYAMEWVDGESLGQRVKNSGALLLLRAVADALTVLGEQRLVHRDIKPDNIMIARAGRTGSRVKLIDFGLAKALENAGDRFTSVDTGERFVGSVYFASPEQIRPRGELDSRKERRFPNRRPKQTRAAPIFSWRCVAPSAFPPRVSLRRVGGVDSEIAACMSEMLVVLPVRAGGRKRGRRAGLHPARR